MIEFARSSPYGASASAMSSADAKRYGSSRVSALCTAAASPSGRSGRNDLMGSGSVVKILNRISVYSPDSAV